MKTKIIPTYNSETKDYHPHLKQRLQETFPGCTVLKNDPNRIQGIEDFTVLYGKKWATLEAKISEKARRKPEPNQEHYVEQHGKMSYSAFVYPENEDQVFEELREHFKD